MKTELASLELKALVSEFHDIIGTRLDQIYDLGKKEMLLQFHKTGYGKLWIQAGPRFIWLRTDKPETPQQPSSFCTFLRKTIGGARVLAIEQFGAERALVFTLGRKEGEFRLIFELFARGNIILCGSDNIIIALLEEQHVAGRDLKRKQPYRPPEGANPFEMDQEAFISAITSSKEVISKALATKVGLGGTYAAELCARAGIDPKDLGAAKAAVQNLYAGLRKMLKAKPSPVIMLKDGKPVDCALWHLNAFKNALVKKVKTLSEALDLIVEQHEIAKPVVSAKSKTVKRLEKSIARQENGLKALEQKEALLQRAGEICYERTAELQLLIDTLKAGRKGLDKEQFLKKFRSKGIISYNPKTAEVEIELD